MAAAIYFALLTAAGILLARGVPLGRDLSVYAQWCQVPYIVTAAFTYVIFTPASFVLRSTSDGWFGFEAALAAQVSLFLQRPNVSGSVGVNLLPLLMIVLITRQGSTRHKEAGPALAA